MVNSTFVDKEHIEYEWREENVSRSLHLYLPGSTECVATSFSINIYQQNILSVTIFYQID